MKNGNDIVVGATVRITTMARTDAFGQVIARTENGRWLVRLPNWQADGYHLDAGCEESELEVQ